ncbi:hypothetical protein [Pseudonocardia nigra]|uniref:hypothetical protein n=1 Tax=Pseudonocardia nigra TaxID=1921578 RepID=UPI001C5D834D|nr:hypothetical protein [Pseudonocardia nigra]
MSDVDLMLVLTGLDDRAAARVDLVRDRVRAAGAGELAQRLSIFWSDWPGVQQGIATTGRLPEVDRLDLLDSGRLLQGVDQRAGAERPDPAVIVRQAAEFALWKFDDRYIARLGAPADLVAEGARSVTKAVLFPVRFLYTLATRRIGRNEAAARWFVAEREHGDLPEAALVWRRDGISEACEAEALLARHLVPINAMFAREYAYALRTSGHVALADDLARWGERVTRAGARLA